MSGVLQRYGVDPRELSLDQLYKLALILQLLQAQEKTGTTSRFNLVFLGRNLQSAIKSEHSFASTQVPMIKTSSPSRWYVCSPRP